MAKKKFHGSKGSGFAGLPESVTMKDWPASPYGDVYEGLDDTIAGIDHQMKEDGRGKSFKKKSYPEKF